MNRRHLLALAGSGVVLAGAPVYWAARWRYITIHHSGGHFGDIELLRRVHRERQPNDPVDAIPYHFVIGNGNGLRLGEVVMTARWRFRVWGAHLSTGNIDRNFRGIGICLVGNFETAEVPEVQFQAAVSLSRDLMRRFSISHDRLTLHGHTPGETTLCPGRKFPRERFLRAARI